MGWEVEENNMKREKEECEMVKTNVEAYDGEGKEKDTRKKVKRKKVEQKKDRKEVEGEE